jgi:hypothetical protein
MIRVFFRSRTDTAMKVLALRTQVIVLKRQATLSKLNSYGRFLDSAPALVVPMARCPGDRQT